MTALTASRGSTNLQRKPELLKKLESRPDYEAFETILNQRGKTAREAREVLRFKNADTFRTRLAHENGTGSTGSGKKAVQFSAPAVKSLPEAQAIEYLERRNVEVTEKAIQDLQAEFDFLSENTGRVGESGPAAEMDRGTAPADKKITAQKGALGASQKRRLFGEVFEILRNVKGAGACQLPLSCSNRLLNGMWAQLLKSGFPRSARRAVTAGELRPQRKRACWRG